MSERNIIFYGCGSPLIADYEELCQNNDVQIKAIFMNIEDSENHAVSKSIVYGVEQIDQFRSIPFLCPLFTSFNRYMATKEALGLGLSPFGFLSDKSNLLPANFEHGKGCFLNKGIVFGSASVIRDFVLINRGACLGHHIKIEDYASIGPGVTTGGNVTIRRGAVLGTGSTILPEMTIGKHAIIGAGSVVTKNVPDNTVVMGNPAKIIKQTKISF